MDRESRERLKRLLRNSPRFLWGVLPGRHDQNLKWLEDELVKGLPGENRPRHLKGSYEHVTELLIEECGIERIARFAEETVRKYIEEDLLSYLSQTYHDGRRPTIEGMEKYSAYGRYANAFLGTKARTKSHRPFDSLITALVELNPQPIPGTKPIEYRMSVGGWGPFAYVLWQELAEIRQHDDDDFPTDEKLREHAEILGVSLKTLKEARRLEQQAMQDFLSEVVGSVKGILDRRSIEGPMEIILLVSDSREVTATHRRIKK